VSAPRSAPEIAGERCLLCLLALGEAERSVVHEDERAIAILDLFPVNPGHTLVFPKSHVALLGELEQEDANRLFQLCRRIAAALYRSELHCEGVNLFLAEGEAAGQEVQHLHLHVIPRFAGDPFRIEREGGWQEERRAELDRVAGQLAEAFEEAVL
jgi:diadenosine tetraphosphate (Ap4A) HIT family hydrolase